MRKSRLVTFLLSLMLLIGFSLLLYPSLSDYWNSFHSSRVISNYTQKVAEIDTETYNAMLEEINTYNISLLERENPYLLTDEMKEKYDALLNMDGNGVMGYIEIPSISCSIPLYHTTEERVLQKAVGHIQWTSLPIGGKSTHSVLSGHRGLPSARLFTDMDKIIEGDIFYLYILNEVLTYQVDQILIVEPTDTEDLLIVPEEDFCTLVTCTPYGINTHRLLVRGKRVETDEKAVVTVTSEAVQIEPIIVAPIISIPMLFLLLVLLYLPKPKRVQYRGD